MMIFLITFQRTLYQLAVDIEFFVHIGERRSIMEVIKWID